MRPHFLSREKWVLFKLNLMLQIEDITGYTLTKVKAIPSLGQNSEFGLFDFKCFILIVEEI